jgi:NADH dehydrogenase/NADH:ubiquinone oxidoreductase subunit G
LKGIATMRRYRATPKGMASQHRAATSSKGRESHRQSSRRYGAANREWINFKAREAYAHAKENR